jgi:predicted transposase/invertase (TIGR01784 family)
MPKPINNLHDKFVKDMLSDKELATAFLEEMLPEEVVEQLDLPSLTYNDKSYITPELDEIFSDMVMDLRLKTGKSLQITILLEHKSYIDANAPIQILRYLAEAYHKQLIAKEPLRPILPLLYYHGRKKWKFEQFENTFDSFPDIFRKYLPLYISEFVSLQELDEAALSKLRNSMLHATLEIQRYDADPATLIKRLHHIMNNLNPYINSGFVIKILIYLFQSTEITIEDFRQNLPQPIIDKAMSTYDRIKEEGKAEGIDEGIEKNSEKSVLNAFDNNIDLKTIQIITGESLEKINAILKANGRV